MHVYPMQLQEGFDYDESSKKLGYSQYFQAGDHMDTLQSTIVPLI